MLSKLLKKTQKPQLGLDISYQGITGVLLGKENKKLFLKVCSYEPFEEEVIQNGLIINPAAFNKTLMNLINKNKIDVKTVNIAVPSNVAFIKNITLPDLALEELKVIANQEASKHIPFGINDVNIDFEILESTRKQETSGKKIDVVLVALAKTIAKSNIDMLYDIGFSISAIDVAPFAMIRTLANAGLIDESDSLCISVLVGYENTDINVIYKGKPLFSHNTPIGKKNIIDSLENNLGIDNQSVENLLPQVALIVPGINISLDPQLSKAATIARTIYNNISGEIQKTIEFYNSQNTEIKEIERVIIGGAGICIQNIDKYIASRLKIDTLLCNSLNNIENNIDYSENSIYPINIPALATSVGLALRGLQN
ncbi:MAG: type IV pilus assembly protein PilM [bacterium]